MALYDAALLAKKLKEVNENNIALFTAIHDYERLMLKNGFNAVKSATNYTYQAISENKFARIMGHWWFRLCSRVPLFKRWTFGSNWTDNTVDTV